MQNSLFLRGVIVLKQQQNRHYAKATEGSVSMIGGILSKKKASPVTKVQMGVVQKIVLPVETNTHKLVKYCCGLNYFKEGEEVELKDDSEYPDWLWNIHVGPPKTLDQLDRNTVEYWKLAHKLTRKRKMQYLKYTRELID